MNKVPPLLRSGTNWPTLLALAGLAASLALLAFFDPVTSGFFPICPLHKYTGLWCPGCGALRASHELFHAHWIAALRLNPLFVLSLPFLCWWGAQQFHPGFFFHKTAVVFAKPFWTWIFLAAVVTFGILRNVPVAPFTYLKP